MGAIETDTVRAAITGPQIYIALLNIACFPYSQPPAAASKLGTAG